MTEVLGRIRTADGYVFYHLADDSIVDSLDPASVDMSWPTLQQFAQANGDDGTATMDCTLTDIDTIKRKIIVAQRAITEIEIRNPDYIVERGADAKKYRQLDMDLTELYAIQKDHDAVVHGLNVKSSQQTVLWTYMTAQEEQCRYAYDREQHDNERQMGEHEESI